MCVDERLEAEIVAHGDRARFSDIESAVSRESLLSTRGNGIVTYAFETSSASSELLTAIEIFRLAQYVQLDWVDMKVVADRWNGGRISIDSEAGDIHVIGLSEDGVAVGYICLATPKASSTGGLIFDTELAHRVPLLSDHDRNHARELKRFVKKVGLKHDSEGSQIVIPRVMTAAYLAAGIAGTSYVIGDIEEHVALRHLDFLGIDLSIVYGTAPELAVGCTMRRMYEVRGNVVPFTGGLPPRAAMIERGEWLVNSVRNIPVDFGWRAPDT